VTPDQLTTAATLLSLSAALCILASSASPLWLLGVPPAVIARIACNALDGMVAKSTGVARPLGEVYNEFSDRVADALIFGALALRVDHLLGAGTLVLVMLSSYLGTVARAAGGRRQYGGVMGKADRMGLLAVASPLAVLLGVTLVMRIFLAAIALGMLVTLAQRARAIKQDLGGVRYPS
jgi:phosphatidylglycerophosphate synthase